MTFEGSFLLAFAVILGVPVLLLLARLIGWLTGTKSKPIWVVLLALVVLFIAFSVYLDNAGTVQQVKVVSKNDEIKLGRNGSWSRSISLGIEYDDPQEGSPTLLQLSCDAATYDRVQVGQTVTAHVLDYGEVLKFARLENRSTFSFLTEMFSAPPRGPWQETTATVQAVQHITKYHSRRHTTILRWPFDVVEFSFVPAGH
ncbi:MAG TPA: hypothetical protein VFZ34_17630, partial [Blastocatellia bacterium]|nr:hypothetical protein [Blastocatellia bacterium]